MNVALRALKVKFYKKMRDLYDITDDKITEVLEHAGFVAFRLDDIKQYEMTISSYMEAETEQINKAQEKTGKQGDGKVTAKPKDWEEVKRLLNPKPVKPTIPCPIIGCTGKKNFNKGNSRDWECTAGGDSHYLAIRTAVIWKNLHPDGMSIEEKATEFIKHLEEARDEQREKETQVHRS